MLSPLFHIFSQLRNYVELITSQVTGEEPSPEEVKGFTEELHKRSNVPANVLQTIDTLPVAPGQHGT